ncbi:hypothetical protein J6590_075801 [Homalodisca vitripennis]|nr:hypothetical protein J6590_075801 [Homalodisca vitripennis]
MGWEGLWSGVGGCGSRVAGLPSGQYRASRCRSHFIPQLAYPSTTPRHTALSLCQTHPPVHPRFHVSQTPSTTLAFTFHSKTPNSENPARSARALIIKRQLCLPYRRGNIIRSSSFQFCRSVRTLNYPGFTFHSKTPNSENPARSATCAN